MGSREDSLSALQSLVSPSEIISPTSPVYNTESSVWDVARDFHPKLLLRPATVESLAKIVAYLYESDLDWAVRSEGFGNGSARDVLISMKAFDEFNYDAEKREVIVGAGQDWRTYYEAMEREAPGMSVVACRTPSIGIGGSILHGGYSWLSREYGCTSDPSSLLDCLVVKFDGSILWASSEPPLLWALRGGGAGFAIVVRYKLRCFPYPRTVWAGPILISKKYLPTIAKNIAAMDAANSGEGADRRVSMFLYLMPKELLGFPDAEDDYTVVHAFDGRGEEAGRKEFRWALELPGAIDRTGARTLREVSELQAAVASVKGKNTCEWAAMALAEITEEMILRAFEWKNEVSSYEALNNTMYLIFELFATRDVIGDRSETAWPRPPGIKHVLLLSGGTAPDAPQKDRDIARKYLVDGPARILQVPKEDVVYVPNACEEFQPLEQVYGEHLKKLEALKGKYDPKRRVKGNIR